jgi:hypothetical protein
MRHGVEAGINDWTPLIGSQHSVTGFQPGTGAFEQKKSWHKSTVQLLLSLHTSLEVQVLQASPSLHIESR